MIFIKSLLYFCPLDESLFKKWMDTIFEMKLSLGARLDICHGLLQSLSRNFNRQEWASNQMQSVLENLIEELHEDFARLIAGDLPESCVNTVIQSKLNLIQKPLLLPEDFVVVVVDDLSKLKEAERVLSTSSMIGVDTETRPVFVKGYRAQKTSLVQIACDNHNCIYLFDLRTDPSVQSSILRLLSDLFINKNIVKLGVGLENDLKELYQSYKCFSTANSIVNIHDLFRIIYPGSAVKSLQKLTRMCTGYRLSKSCQTSNWNNRPLSSSQIKYAALDAYVLLIINDYLTKYSFVSWKYFVFSFNCFYVE
jgi:hypothetical protein